MPCNGIITVLKDILFKIMVEGAAMSKAKNKPVGRLKWYIIGIAAIVVVLLTLFSGMFDKLEAGEVPQIAWLAVSLIITLSIITVASKAVGISQKIEENNLHIEKIASSLEKNLSVLNQIGINTRLSETAKSIASREADRYTLREAVLEKLHQQDFDSTYEIIDEISHSSVYKDLTQSLRDEADQYRNATAIEREKQVIAHIDKLLGNYQWTKASILTERLISIAPNSDNARGMRQKLLDKKRDRKNVLLKEWDEAIKREATDHSLDILKELDLYLTPNEGLALQEAAKDVFRTKLHNLGVQFSLAVSSKQWDNALEAGEQIIKRFPNSKMAAEIRTKINILKQKAQ